MCVVAVGWRVFNDSPLVIWSNRDEFVARPTAPVARWSDHPGIVAGRDLQAGGTWLGVHQSGRFATVTNFRDPTDRVASPLSRGNLPVQFLSGALNPVEFIESIRSSRARYPGFLLLVGDVVEGCIYESRLDRVTPLPVGVTAFSNGELANPWPKCQRLAAAMQAQTETQLDVERGFEALLDPQRAKSHLLPKTGIAPEVETALSSVFVSPITIRDQAYQTRSSTILLRRDNAWNVHERRFDRSAGAEKSSAYMELAC